MQKALPGGTRGAGRDLLVLLAALAGMVGCGHATPAPPESAAQPLPHSSAALSAHEQTFMGDLRQLTFGGENAEAYFGFDGAQLSLQIRREGENCDRIYRMPVNVEKPEPERVSTGHGATTCAHFLPDGSMIYASTHLGGPACPPRPDMSLGYVWALYDTYDIFATGGQPGANQELVQLTKTPGYDAEGTVCGKDGSIIFTSVRDGDIELYRMDRDGGNVKRLTDTPGYDGGAFFSADCSKIVWRASRPQPGAELDDYRRLLGQGLVRPSKLEIWIANADGSEPMQLTYLDAASFAPFFHPTQPFIVFSSNHGDPRGREFDLWAVGLDGSALTRITNTPGFDGFPHFSPDGKTMAFSSNRATAPGARDTNVFLVHWNARWPFTGQSAQDPATTSAARIANDIRWLSDPARDGRGAGTPGLEAAGKFLSDRLQELGYEGAGDNGGFTQTFDVPTAVTIDAATSIKIAGLAVDREALTVPGFSGLGTARGAMVLAGYGVVDKVMDLDEYGNRQVKNKIVLVRRFAPEGKKFSDTEVKRRLGDLRKKAWLARQRGARALVVVDWPVAPAEADENWQAPNEAALPSPEPPGAGDDAGIPVIIVNRAAIEGAYKKLLAGKSVPVELHVALTFKKQAAFNVIGRLRANGTGDRGPVMVGAHYDHLGYGHHGSLAPDSKAAHVGADDNASGTATVLEIARALAANQGGRKRDVLVAFFSGEEWGLLGSSHYVRTHKELTGQLAAMLNLDMVGRLRRNQVQVLGVKTGAEWNDLVQGSCATERVLCEGDGGGYGPSDQAAFYPAGVPVLHFFTGSHSDYHKPSDTADRINAAGAAVIARVVAHVTDGIDRLASARLTYEKVDEPSPRGDMRSFNASLGTIPDYAGPGGDKKGVLLSGVRPGSGADRAGMKRGDILIRLGTYQIRSVHDLMFALNESKPNETVTAVVVRGDKEVQLKTTFQEAHARH